MMLAIAFALATLGLVGSGLYQMIVGEFKLGVVIFALAIPLAGIGILLFFRFISLNKQE